MKWFAFLGFRVGVELQPFCVENSKIDSILERTGFLLGVSEEVSLETNAPPGWLRQNYENQNQSTA